MYGFTLVFAQSLVLPKAVRSGSVLSNVNLVKSMPSVNLSLSLDRFTCLICAPRVTELRFYSPLHIVISKSDEPTLLLRLPF